MTTAFLARTNLPNAIAQKINLLNFQTAGAESESMFLPHSPTNKPAANQKLP